jgi:hypothetical protein
MLGEKLTLLKALKRHARNSTECLSCTRTRKRSLLAKVARVWSAHTKLPVWDEASDPLGLEDKSIGLRKKQHLSSLSKTTSCKSRYENFLVSVLVSLGTVKQRHSLRLAANHKNNRTLSKP